MMKVDVFVVRLGVQILEWVFRKEGRLLEKHEVEDRAVVGLSGAVSKLIEGEFKSDVPGHGLRLEVDRSAKKFRVEVILCKQENCLVCAKAVERNLFMPGNTRWISVQKPKSTN